MAMPADASSEKPAKIAPTKEIIANPAATISQCDSDPMPFPLTTPIAAKSSMERGRRAEADASHRAG
jgi:hypothetical protein